MKRLPKKIVVNPARTHPVRPFSITPGNQIEAHINAVPVPAPVLNKNTSFSAKSSDRVFIIGGGTSVNSIDLSLLDGEDIICVNKSIELIDNPTFFITMDYTFFGKTKLSIQSIAAKAKSSHFVINKTHSYLKEINGCYTDTRSNLKYAGLEHFTSVIESESKTNVQTGFGLSRKEFCNGDNSGYCAIQFAILAGYKEIYLIGFDLNAEKNRTHYHNEYSAGDYSLFVQKLQSYIVNLLDSISRFQLVSKASIMSLTPTTLSPLLPYKKNFFRNHINKKVDTSIKLPKERTPVDKIKSEPSLAHTVDSTSSLSDLIIVAYYTINTPYEDEAKKLIRSLNKLGLNHDVVGVPNLGNWQANTRFKAGFMTDMLNKHQGKNLLYIDSDAIVHSRPVLFENYNADIAVRWQDFRWRQNECLSGTIFMANNDKTRELCSRWQKINRSEGPNATTFEQWNLGSVIKQMESEGKLITKNLPPEYTMIFDSMRAMYPDIVPVIEHFQASRTLRNKV